MQGLFYHATAKDKPSLACANFDQTLQQSIMTKLTIKTTSGASYSTVAVTKSSELIELSFAYKLYLTAIVPDADKNAIGAALGTTWITTNGGSKCKTI